VSGGVKASGVVYGLKCIRCGAGLELPQDPQSIYMDCPYCGQDNVLPQYLIDARQRQYAAAVQARLRQQQLAQQAANRAAARKRGGSPRTLVLLIVLALFGLPLLGIASCMGFVFYAAGEQVDAERRAQDRTLNGAPQVEAEIRTLRTTGCDYTVIRPESHTGRQAPFWLQFPDTHLCMHLLTATGEKRNRLGIRFTTPDTEFVSPTPATQQNARFCAAQQRKYNFTVTSSTGDPFTVAVVSCPRQEPGSSVRSKVGDDSTTGRNRTVALLKQLHEAGCAHVVSTPTVQQGEASYTVTSVKGGQCYNFFAVSSYPDVKFEFEWLSPIGERLPVPPPTHEARLVYCPRMAGKHKLRVKPSTQDHYTVAAIDCPRAKREGLQREREMIAQAKAK